MKKPAWEEPTILQIASDEFLNQIKCQLFWSVWLSFMCSGNFRPQDINSIDKNSYNYKYHKIMVAYCAL